jgi:hypothetical protein
LYSHIEQKTKIMKNLLLFFSFIVINLSLSAQCFWAKQLGGNSTVTDITVASIKARNGYVYTTGTFLGVVDFDAGTNISNLTSVGNEDIFICKNDSIGNFVWAKRIGGAGNDGGLSITLDNQQNIIVAGAFNGTVDFDPGAGIFNLVSLTTGSNSAGFILKLDNNGNLVNAVQLSSNVQTGISPMMRVNCTSLQIDINGNIIVGGKFSNNYDINGNPQLIDFNPGNGSALLSAGDEENYFVLKLTSTLTYVWAKNFCAWPYSAGVTSVSALASDYNAEIATGSNGSIYFTAKFYSPLGSPSDFDPGAGVANLTALGTYDIFVLKLNTNGLFQWVKQLVGNGVSYGENVGDIKVDSNDDVLVTGSFTGTADFDPSVNTLTYTALGINIAGFVWKLSNTGALVFAKIFAGSALNYRIEPLGLDVSNNSDIYLTGFAGGDVDFDPGIGNFVFPVNIINGVVTNSCFILKLSNNGDLTWAKQLTSASGRDLSYSNNGIYSNGIFNATADFDPSSGIFNLTTPAGNASDVYLHKLNDLTTPVITASGSIICQGQEIVLSTSIVAGSTYQWQKNGVNISGATTLNYSANSAGSYTVLVTSSGGCSNISTAIVLTIVNSVTPTFSQLPYVCAGESIILPTISNENISGSWSPAINNTATTTYTFTPNASQCASSQTMTVEVAPLITPTFPQISAICAGETITLPLVSNQNIPGSWSPNVNNQSTTTYNFTPNAGQCANSQTMTVTVNSYPTINTQPTSTQVNIGNQAIFTTSANGGTYQWQVDIGSGFQNITNGGQFSGATTNTLTVSNTSMSNNTSQYQCVVTSNNCSSTSNSATLTVINNVGLNEADQLNNLEIYPNPTSNFVTVRFNNNLLGNKYDIVDNTGRIVLSGLLLDQNQIVELNALSAGIYIFSVSGEHAKSFVKIIKS